MVFNDVDPAAFRSKAFPGVYGDLEGTQLGSKCWSLVEERSRKLGPRYVSSGAMQRSKPGHSMVPPMCNLPHLMGREELTLEVTH